MNGSRHNFCEFRPTPSIMVSRKHESYVVNTQEITFDIHMSTRLRSIHITLSIYKPTQETKPDRIVYDSWYSTLQPKYDISIEYKTFPRHRFWVSLSKVKRHVRVTPLFLPVNSFPKSQEYFLIRKFLRIWNFKRKLLIDLDPTSISIHLNWLQLGKCRLRIW